MPGTMNVSGTINAAGRLMNSGTINVIGALGGNIPELDNSGVLNLGGFGLTIPDIQLLKGGVLENGLLFGAITSSGGTIDGIGGMAAVDGPFRHNDLAGE